jgi:ornithine cyclodeaminase
MREYPVEFYSLLDYVFIDSRQAVEESGDLSYALQKGLLKAGQVRTLGSYIHTADRIQPGQTRFFKTVGMGLFDLLTARRVYEIALEKGLGTRVDFP